MIKIMYQNNRETDAKLNAMAEDFIRENDGFIPTLEFKDKNMDDLLMP